MVTAAGTAGVTLSSTTAGPAIITASGPGGTPAGTLNVVFVATSATSAAVQAIPGTVQVSTGAASQTNNSSIITVQVRDAANNLVKNAGVSFTLTDTSGGRLTSASGITDESGSKSVTYIAGGTSSAQNGVTVTATVTDISGVAIVPVTASTNLTVAGQSLLVRLGTDNLVGGVSPLNTKTYVAIVTDAAGNPSVGTNVSFSLKAVSYSKGTHVVDATIDKWNQKTSINCPSLDKNNNGILDPGEELVGGVTAINWNGQTPHLLPGAIASVNASGTTDASGFATATITYAKDQARWVEVTLEARTSVTTNDPPTQVTFFLPGLVSDYAPTTKNPPGFNSPYGTGTLCTDLK
jgi:adhesin/invasin